MKRTGRSNAYKYTSVVTMSLILSVMMTVGCGPVEQEAAPVNTTRTAVTKPVPNTVSSHTSPTVQQTKTDNATEPDHVMTLSQEEHDLQQQTPVTIPPVNLSQAVFFNGPHTSTKIVALTFDDGPDDRWTPEILDVLKQYNVKATFFLIGSHAQEYPNVVRRIASEGHVIGNHTWDHPQLTKLNGTQVRNEITRTDETIYSIVGYHPTVLRPPYGAFNATTVQEAKSLGYKVVNWSVDSRDWAGASTQQIMRYVNTELYPGGIILQHSSGGKNGSLANTVAALREEITSLRAQGYTFVTVPQMLGIPAERN